MKKINITTGVLVIYLIVMSVWGWPGKQPDPDWARHAGTVFLGNGSIPLRHSPAALSAS